MYINILESLAIFRPYQSHQLEESGQLWFRHSAVWRH